MYKELLDALCVRAKAAQSAFDKVDVGALPEGEGLSLALASGGETEAALDFGGVETLAITVNARHADQAVCLKALGDLHRTLTKARSLPSGNGWQVLGVHTVAAPSSAGRKDGLWLYVSALELDVGLE